MKIKQNKTAEDVLNMIAGYVMYDDDEDDCHGTMWAHMHGRNSVKASIRDILNAHTDITFND